MIFCANALLTPRCRMNKRMFCSAFAAVVYSIFSNNKLSDQCHLYYTLRFWFCQAKRGTYNFVAVRVGRPR